MSAAQSAGRILEAWNQADYSRFENELERAAVCCRTEAPVSILEDERRELLESVVSNLRTLRGTDGNWQVQRMNTAIDLLRHLRRTR